MVSKAGIEKIKKEPKAIKSYTRAHLIKYDLYIPSYVSSEKHVCCNVTFGYWTEREHKSIKKSFV